MADTNEMVITAFVEGRAARTPNLRSTGKALYSYDYKLAWRSEVGGFVWVNYQNTGITLDTYNSSRSYDAAFSPTTTRHRNALLGECRARHIETWQHTEGM
jgi:hypothetical protein